MKYYRLADNQVGGYLHTGYNDTSLVELRESLISYLGADYPDASDEDWQSILQSDVNELAEIADVTIESNTSPYEERPALV